MLRQIVNCYPQTVFWTLFLTLLVLLALPAAIRTRSLKRLVIAMLQVLVGIVVPVFWFLASCALVPEWKGACKLGWFDCFALGKIWLSPVVLWALCAFYVRMIWQSSNPAPRWMVLGYAAGAAVSSFCFIHGVLVLYRAAPALIVPAIVAVHYCRVAWKLAKEATIPASLWWTTGVGSLPLWIASFWQSRQAYVSLPDQQPAGCFIVTAAMGGHESIVGPRFKFLRAGRERLVNRQLLTFWALESAWQNVSPRSHSQFRRIYNVIGPRIAARVTLPWIADMIHLLLKPGEWLAFALLWLRRWLSP